MALITCPECKKQISENALSCPDCGLQLTEEIVAKQKEIQNNKKRSFHNFFENEVEDEQPDERSFHDSLEDSYPRRRNVFHESSGKKIRETKCTCQGCGHTWFYGMQDVLDSTAASFHNFGKEMMCCTGCFPAVFIPESKVTDPGRCPKCGSKAFRKEVVIHEV